MSRRPRPGGKAPPNAEVAPEGATTKAAQDPVGHKDPTQTVPPRWFGRHDGAGLELQPRRGHSADGCDTCERIAVMTARWREQELIALRSRQRVIDLPEMA